MCVWVSRDLAQDDFMRPFFALHFISMQLNETEVRWAGFNCVLELIKRFTNETQSCLMPSFGVDWPNYERNWKKKNFDLNFTGKFVWMWLTEVELPGLIMNENKCATIKSEWFIGCDIHFYSFKIKKRFIAYLVHCILQNRLWFLQNLTGVAKVSEMHSQLTMNESMQTMKRHPFSGCTIVFIYLFISIYVCLPPNSIMHAGQSEENI